MGCGCWWAACGNYVQHAAYLSMGRGETKKKENRTQDKLLPCPSTETHFPDYGKLHDVLVRFNFATLTAPVAVAR